MMNTQGFPWERLCKEIIEDDNIIWSIRMISCSFPKHFLQSWKSILAKASAFTQVVREISIAAPGELVAGAMTLRTWACALAT